MFLKDLRNNVNGKPAALISPRCREGYPHPGHCTDRISLSETHTKPEHLLRLCCLWGTSTGAMGRAVGRSALCGVLQCPRMLLRAGQRGSKRRNLSFLLRQQALHFVLQCEMTSLYIQPPKEGELDTAMKVEALPWDCPYFNRDGCAKVENILV